VAQIHPTAIVERGAEIAATATVGPYCHVGAKVVLGEAVELLSHVVVAGRTSIGEGTRIFPFASIGQPPQDLKYAGEDSSLIIGQRNIIREYVTMNPGTSGGGMVTRIGDHCLFMANAHIGHDCQLGSHIIIANSVPLAGHVVVGDHAAFGGLSAVHQFVRIGRHAYVGGLTGVERDVIPFGLVMGDRARLAGLNMVGLQRRGFSREDIQSLRGAYQMLFEDGSGTLGERVDAVAARWGHVGPVEELVAFMRADNARGFVQPKSNGG
jgi:UDP-N-acetylglucosamine acyltransferase